MSVLTPAFARTRIPADTESAARPAPPSTPRPEPRPAHSPAPLRARTLPVDELVALVRGIAATPDLWSHALRFDPAQRYYAKLDSEPGVDVWLLTWLPSQSTELHDHGGSSAAIAVVHGDLAEVRADATGRLTTHLRRSGTAHALGAGVVHDVGHAGTGNAVSIHAYSPPLSHMRYYEASAAGLEVVRTELVTLPEQLASTQVSA